MAEDRKFKPHLSRISLQAPRINSAELDAPEPNRFTADNDATFCQQVFEITVTPIESVVQPEGMADNVRRKLMALVYSHPPILAVKAVNLAIPKNRILSNDFS